MKKLEIPGYLLSLAGFLLKIFHIHFHTIVILISIIYLLFIYGYAGVTRQIRKEKLYLGLSSTFLITWLLFIAKFFPLPYIPMVVGILLLGISIYIKTKRREHLLDSRQWINMMILVLCLIFLQLPRNERYYLFTIRYNYEIETDYRTWDKYSYFLFLDDKYEDALWANANALKIVERTSDGFWKKKIGDHKKQIVQRNWKSYP